jgi:hypothetical protein
VVAWEGESGDRDRVVAVVAAVGPSSFHVQLATLHILSNLNQQLVCGLLNKLYILLLKKWKNISVCQLRLVFKRQIKVQFKGDDPGHAQMHS